MIEVERKRELADPAALKARLIEAGYREMGTCVETDTYYSRPDRDFLVTVECLRVRHRDGFAEITYKPASTADTHSASDIIAKAETNVILFDSGQANAANTLLDVLGMMSLCRVAKARTTFRHPDDKNILVLLDVVTDVGAFVETEVMASDIVEASELLAQVEQQLGLTDFPVMNVPYRDLVLQSGNQTA
jgi:adenylate cyclase class 2